MSINLNPKARHSRTRSWSLNPSWTVRQSCIWYQSITLDLAIQMPGNREWVITRWASTTNSSLMVLCQILAEKQVVVSSQSSDIFWTCLSPHVSYGASWQIVYAWSYSIDCCVSLLRAAAAKKDKAINISISIRACSPAITTLLSRAWKVFERSEIHDVQEQEQRPY